MPGLTFEQLEVPAPVLRAITARGYETPTPVQEAVLAKELIGRDLLVSSRTGSGKTLAFGLVMAPVLLGGAERMPAAPSPLALIVAPTRELANQISEELGWLFAQAGARIATCVGGVEMGKELRALRDGPHIIVGTPGRLVDHLERKSLKPGALKVLVLDEADEMLDMGFRDELERILRDTPAQRQTLLFSATIDKPIEALAKSYQRDAARVSATAPNQAHQDIEVRAHLIASREREHAVVNTLRAADAQTAIVFCGTRDHVNHLHASLVERGFAAVALSGELTQPERFRALKALRDGRARVLVATDVAARGLDLPDVGIVVQADLPQNAEVWQHRSGRTGRAGRKGVSVLLVPGGSQRTAEMMLRKAGAKASWSPAPGPEQIASAITRASSPICRSSRRRRPRRTSRSRGSCYKTQSAEQLAAALVAIRRAGLPAPEDLPLSAQMQAGRPSGQPGRHVATHPTARAREPEANSWTSPRSGESTRPSAAPTFASTPAPRAHASEAARAKPLDAKPFHAKPAHESRAKPSAPATPTAAKSPWARKGYADDEGPRPKAKRSHAEFGDAVWFSVNVGRARNADPRWLLPLICRKGSVVKEQIGKIQILADETRFQIVADAAGTFEKSAKKPDTKDPGVHVKRCAKPGSDRDQHELRIEPRQIACVRRHHRVPSPLRAQDHRCVDHVGRACRCTELACLFGPRRVERFDLDQR